MSYDLEGRLAQVLQGSRATTYAYDTAGFVASVQDALAQTSTFDHDAVGRLLREVRPDLAATLFSYDANAA